MRAVVTVHDGRVTVASRLGNDVTGGYPELAGLADALGGRSAVLDGEIVAFDDRTGRPSFQRLQRRMHVRQPGAQLRRDVPIQLLLFDVLWLDGELVAERPQTERRKVLEGLALEGPCWHTSPLIPPAPADELLDACRRIGMEGYVAKRADAPYRAGPAVLGVDQGQVRQAPGVRGRRLVGGPGWALRAPSARWPSAAGASTPGPAAAPAGCTTSARWAQASRAN